MLTLNRYFYQTKVLWFCATLLALPAFADTTADFEQLLADESAARVEETPVWAVAIGAKAHLERMRSASPEYHQNVLAGARSRLQRLNAIDRSALPAPKQLDYDLLAWDLTQKIAQGEFPHYLLPIDGEGGFLTAPFSIAGSIPLTSAGDYAGYLKLLNDIPRHFKEQTDNLKAGLRQGITVPKVIIEKLLPLLESYAGQQAETSALYTVFDDLPETMDESERKRLRQQALQTIRDKVIPAYAATVDYIVNTYYPQTRETLGITQVPGGEAYYRDLLRHHTTLDVSPKQIHETGMNEVRRIRAEMLDVIKTAGFKGDLKAFREFLLTDDQFYAKTPEELLRRAATLAKTIDGRLPRVFHVNTLPRQPYGVEPVPASMAPNYTTGRYIPAAPGARKGGMYWINTYDLKARPLYGLPALTLHEGVPGHHLQYAAVYEVEDAAKFRRFSSYNAFSEGWGLYAEKLGEELGVYTTPYEKFGQLSYEMWRACRLVVDTGIHALGWSRERAVQFMADNTALARHNIETEVNRYIAWPGQATSYKTGQLELLRLRKVAKESLGDDFDVRDYHAVVLKNGTVPLSVLQNQVQEWLESEQTAAAGNP